MAAITNELWKNAQIAEKKYSRSLKNINYSEENHNFIKKLGLDPDLFLDKQVLQIGCGPLGEIHQIKNTKFRIGIDPLAKSWSDLYPTDIDHICGIGECLPFKDNTFDIILCLNVLDHVLNPSITLNEARRVLIRGGSLILWVHTYNVPKKITDNLQFIDKPHTYHFSDIDVYSLIRKSNFNVAYYMNEKPNILNIIKGLGTNDQTLLLSRFKHLCARLFLGLNGSTYICNKI